MPFGSPFPMQFAHSSADFRKTKHLKIQVEFIRAQSYQDQASTGQLRIEGMEALGHGQRIRGKQVLVSQKEIELIKMNFQVGGRHH